MNAMFPVRIFRYVDERIAMETVIWIIIGRVAMHGRNSPAIKLIEAPMVGRCVFIVAVQMPFVYQAGPITGCAQYGGYGGVLRQKVGTAHDGRITVRVDFDACNASCGAHVVADAGVAGVASCHQRTTGR